MLSGTFLTKMISVSMFLLLTDSNGGEFKFVPVTFKTKAFPKIIHTVDA